MKKDWDNPRQHAMPEHARVPASFHIAGVKIAPATVLAPMAGVTDTVFRRFIRNASLFTTPQLDVEPTSAPQEQMRVPNPSAFAAERRDAQTSGPGLGRIRVPQVREANLGVSAHTDQDVDAEITNQQSGCGLIMTEFTSADGLARMRESKRKRYLTFYDDEHPIAAQLFGSNPATLADAARIVEDTGFDLVDLNLGCPAKRVVACNGGSGLLRDLPQIARIFEAIRAAVTIPFTVKFRLGWDDRNLVHVELARLAQESGLNAVALHARTREQGYSGQARWKHIAAVKDAVRIPVVGNGDIRTPEDAVAMVAQTGCDAVMIGRAAPANPWIFRQIAQYTALGRYDHPTEMDRYRIIRAYFQMLLAAADAGDDSQSAEAGQSKESQGTGYEGRNYAPGKMKQFAAWFTHGVPGGGALRKAIYECKSGPAILDAVEAFFEARLAGDLAALPEDESASPEMVECSY
jgi:nifR3 family TIM-barrel protein